MILVLKIWIKEIWKVSLPSSRSEISNFTSCSSPRNSLSDNGCSLGFSFSKFFELSFVYNETLLLFYNLRKSLLIYELAPYVELRSLFCVYLFFLILYVINLIPFNPIGILHKFTTSNETKLQASKKILRDTYGNQTTVCKEMSNLVLKVKVFRQEKIQLSRSEQMLSAFSLDKEPYMHTLEEETTPFGLLAKGIYVAKLKGEKRAVRKGKIGDIFYFIWEEEDQCHCTLFRNCLFCLSAFLCI
ncbi:hypothetical protein DVH24_004442 [Malus domestica]|uniref:Uncharacterized protein n=1 Tax=Malus domestica TaxID=3750 RepID=A0A498I9V4_MALDO|nr:hypothetical protein DVH24_004442 [Malus domestica]